jgi:glycosyltransferase involved in cell wall biosynthesis
MPEKKSVAICIPTFNQAQYLPESVGGACRQTYANVEVWVSDDASTDETLQIMAQLCQQFPQIKYYRQPKNLGMVANNSWILSQPKTDFIVHLDSDDVLKPNYVETLLALMERYLVAGYAHSAVQQIDEYGQNQHIGRLARQEEFRSPEKELRAAVSGYRMTANICMFRTKALKELNFYEGRPDFTHDYDLIVRMADAGYGNVYTNEVLACYRVWTDATAFRPRRKSIELRGMIRVYEESLLPAFQRRGWDAKLIYQQRRRLALIHSAFCYRPLFSEAERSELVELLKELGDSLALRLRLFVLRWGCGSFLEWQFAMQSQLKVMIKRLLSELKSWAKFERQSGPQL